MMTGHPSSPPWPSSSKTSLPYRPLLPSITHLTTNRAPRPPYHATCTSFEGPSASPHPSSPPVGPFASNLASHSLVSTDSYTIGHSMDSYEQSGVPSPHRGGRASLSEPAFWSDGSGGKERRYPKVPGAPECVGGAKPCRTGTQRRRREEGFDDPQMTTMRHLPSVLRTRTSYW